jgi:hypothetical protein
MKTVIRSLNQNGSNLETLSVNSENVRLSKKRLLEIKLKNERSEDCIRLQVLGNCPLGVHISIPG